MAYDEGRFTISVDMLAREVWHRAAMQKRRFQGQKSYQAKRYRTRQTQWSPRKRTTSPSQIIMLAGLVGVAAMGAAPKLASSWALASRTPEEIAAIERSAYYPNCNMARAAGAAPIYAGSPGYRDGLDGDSDGIACEPYRGR